MSIITQKQVELLIPFTEQYSCRLTATEISAKTGIPQQTASVQLNMLAKKGIINYTKQGRNKLFYFDLGKNTAELIFSMLELHKSLDFQLKAREVSLIISDILGYSDSVIVFGSYSSGSFRKDSDLDIAILNNRNRKAIKKIKQTQVVEINEHYLTYDMLEDYLKSRYPLVVEMARNHLFFGDVSRLVALFRKVCYERRQD
ncbi:nucleotidyltransferase domain-containing protein [Candidatus Woesearchaeota archaeon]|nr:nucleotidyltransferase domain-containing protein [Candidatus Woesearchaeota archaeon]